MDFSGFIVPKGNYCWIPFIYSLSFFIYYLYEEIFLFFFLENLQLFLAMAEERLSAYEGPTAVASQRRREARATPPRATAAGAEAGDGGPENRRSISLLRGRRWGLLQSPAQRGEDEAPMRAPTLPGARQCSGMREQAENSFVFISLS